MHDYTPNPSNNPSTIPELDDGDTPDVSSINPSIEALADKIAHALIGAGSTTDMQALTSPLPGERFIVAGVGVFFYNPVNTFTPDTKWIYDATGAGVGQWIHELFGFANSGLAAVGPIPGDSSPAANDRIKRSLIDHGYFYHDIASIISGVATTTNTSLTLVEDFTTPALAVGDIVECQIVAAGTCAAPFTVGTYATQGAGAQVLMSPGFGGSNTIPATYPASGALSTVVALSFFLTVTTAGTLNIQVKFATSNGADGVLLSIKSWCLRVTRP